MHNYVPFALIDRLVAISSDSWSKNVSSLQVFMLLHTGHFCVVGSDGARFAMSSLPTLKRLQGSILMTDFNAEVNSNGMKLVDKQLLLRTGVAFNSLISDTLETNSANGFETVPTYNSSEQLSTASCIHFTCVHEDVPYLHVTQCIRFCLSKHTTPKSASDRTQTALSDPTGTNLSANWINKLNDIQAVIWSQGVENIHSKRSPAQVCCRCGLIIWRDRA